jgi:hypothetical protein
LENKNDRSSGLGRRQALQLFGVGLTAVGGLASLAATPALGADAPALNCKEKVELDENQVGLRRALQYKEKAPTPDKHCSICIQFEEGKYGECGGCKVLGGAVNPNGVCLSFAPKLAPAAPGATPAPAPAKPAADKKKT